MSGLKFDTKSLERGIERLESKSEAAIRIFAENAGLKMQTAAKENAKWTDRTGAARNRLSTSTSKIAKGYRVYLYHGVDYGQYLEFAHEKRFAIIFDTIRFEGTFEIMPAFEKFMERL